MRPASPIFLPSALRVTGSRSENTGNEQSFRPLEQSCGTSRLTLPTD